MPEQNDAWLDRAYEQMQKLRTSKGKPLTKRVITFPMDTLCVCGHPATSHTVEDSTALLNCTECEPCEGFFPEGPWVER